MSVGSADLQKAIVTVWDAANLDDVFLALRNASVVDAEFPVLNDQEVIAGGVFPYCVFQGYDGTTTDRMSSVNDGFMREVRDLPLEFRIYARAVSGDDRTAKGIAAYLAEEVMKVFGGHPTTSPTAPTLDNGNFLLAQYQTDTGLHLGDDEYQWSLTYLCRLDVPVGI